MLYLQLSILSLNSTSISIICVCVCVNSIHHFNGPPRDGFFSCARIHIIGCRCCLLSAMSSANITFLRKLVEVLLLSLMQQQQQQQQQQLLTDESGAFEWDAKLQVLLPLLPSSDGSGGVGGDGGAKTGLARKKMCERALAQVRWWSSAFLVRR